MAFSIAVTLTFFGNYKVCINLKLHIFKMFIDQFLISKYNVRAMCFQLINLKSNSKNTVFDCKRITLNSWNYLVFINFDSYFDVQVLIWHLIATFLCFKRRKKEQKLFVTRFCHIEKR